MGEGLSNSPIGPKPDIATSRVVRHGTAKLTGAMRADSLYAYAAAGMRGRMGE